MKFHWLLNWEFWNRLFYFLQTVAFISAGIGIVFLYQTMKHQEKIDSANLVIEFNKQLNEPQYADLMDELSNATSTIILKERGGHFSEGIIDQYLGQYETLGNLYYDNLISCDMLWDNFSDDLKSVYKNKDIQSLIVKDQNENLAYWGKFQKLGKKFDVSKNPCKN